MAYAELSAQSGVGVEELFTNIAAMIMIKEPKEPSISLDRSVHIEQRPRRGTCC